MSIGDFKRIEDAIIIESDYPKIEFGTVNISKSNYVCAVKTGRDVIVLDDSEVKYFSILKTKGISKKAANLIEATVHGVLSTVIPGASLAGALVGNTAAAAAGMAARGTASRVSGGARDYHDIYIEFQNGKSCVVRCPDRYLKTIKKYCLERKISKRMLDKKLEIDNGGDSSGIRRESDDPVKPSEKTSVCKNCNNEVTYGDKFCPKCGKHIANPVETKDKRRHKDRKKNIGKWLLSTCGILLTLLIIVAIINPFLISDTIEAISDFFFERHLEKVIDKCLNNENSKECIDIQKRYNATFKYCYAFYDIPEIDKDIPVYGVAKHYSFRETQFSLLSTLILDDDSNVFPYYGCVSERASIGKNNLDDVSGEDTQALHWLRNRPKAEFDIYNPLITYSGFNSVLWNNVPNFKETVSDVEEMIDRRYYVNTIENRLRMDDIVRNTDNKLKSYAENKVVQAYFWNYDIWNERYNYNNGCIYGKGTKDEIHFSSKCLPKAGSDDYPLNGFTSYMRKKAFSKYYKAVKME